jgi:hypothetical protein
MSLYWVSSSACLNQQRAVLRGTASALEKLANEVSSESLEVVASCSVWEESS